MFPAQAGQNLREPAGSRMSVASFFKVPHFPPGNELLLSLYRLPWTQCFLDVIDEHTAALQAELAAGYLAVTIYKEGGGEHIDSAVAHTDRLFAEQDRVVDAHVFRELGDVVSAG